MHYVYPFPQRADHFLICTLHLNLDHTEMWGSMIHWRYLKTSTPPRLLVSCPQCAKCNEINSLIYHGQIMRIAPDRGHSAIQIPESVLKPNILMTSWHGFIELFTRIMKHKLLTLDCTSIICRYALTRRVDTVQKNHSAESHNAECQCRNASAESNNAELGNENYCSRVTVKWCNN